MTTSCTETEAFTLIRSKLQKPRLPGAWSPGNGCWIGFTPARAGSWHSSRPLPARARLPCWSSGWPTALNPAPGFHWMNHVSDGST